MDLHRDEILQQALALPPEDRAVVAVALARSLASPGEKVLPDDIEADSSAARTGVEFLSELQRRSAAFRNGQSLARSASEVLAELRQLPAGETAS
jgi:hypothetical protein